MNEEQLSAVREAIANSGRSSYECSVSRCWVTGNVGVLINDNELVFDLQGYEVIS